MIVADTSALAAILFEEQDANLYSEAIARADRTLVAAPSALELSIVLRRKSPGAEQIAERFLRRDFIRLVDWTVDLLPFATDALVRFGGRPARLNFGDCIAYAVAKAMDLPLLYKGVDFRRTDIASVL